jgi:hypothetical protein
MISAEAAGAKHDPDSKGSKEAMEDNDIDIATLRSIRELG